MMTWPIIVGGILMGWAILRIVGSERQQRIDGFRREVAAIAARAKEKSERITEVGSAKSR